MPLQSPSVLTTSLIGSQVDGEKDKEPGRDPARWGLQTPFQRLPWIHGRSLYIDAEAFKGRGGAFVT
ncbi:hypothetical protein POX_a00391 [Penicillium oxalicum]|uniref:hypothetical protein n=1 Tax=Penicillium oxalicum TaxID=69781 RepID=UPI0020B6EA9D|nr:hypothetical protein POX_a00391 [Penicillium oxalicum]KAI2793805.1 hypothetical protein POX_a00391 [Penicillium oxalicum]